MRICSMFHTLVVLTVVLILSAPFVTRAQQNPVQAEAITIAEQDAIKDVNKLLWFVAGFAASSVGGTVGALAGCVVGSIIQPPPEAGFLFFTISDAQFVGTIVGGAAGALTPLILIRAYEPNLPPNRFIGKSPEYIDFYTDAYKKKVKSLRTKSAIGGWVVGCIGGVALVFFSLE